MGLKLHALRAHPPCFPPSHHGLTSTHHTAAHWPHDSFCQVRTSFHAHAHKRQTCTCTCIFTLARTHTHTRTHTYTHTHNTHGHTQTQTHPRTHIRAHTHTNTHTHTHAHTHIHTHTHTHKHKHTHSLTHICTHRHQPAISISGLGDLTSGSTGTDTFSRDGGTLSRGPNFQQHHSRTSSRGSALGIGPSVLSGGFGSLQVRMVAFDTGTFKSVSARVCVCFFSLTTDCTPKEVCND